MTRDWVTCPICGEPDMRREDDVTHCVNLACPSNGNHAGGDTYTFTLPSELVSRFMGVHGGSTIGVRNMSYAANDMANALLEQLPEEWPLDQPSPAPPGICGHLHREEGGYTWTCVLAPGHAGEFHHWTAGPGSPIPERSWLVERPTLADLTVVDPPEEDPEDHRLHQWCNAEHREDARTWRCTLDLDHGGEFHRWDPAHVGLGDSPNYRVESWPTSSHPHVPAEQEQETPQQETPARTFQEMVTAWREAWARGATKLLDNPDPPTWAAIGFPHHTAEPDVDYGTPGPLLGPLITLPMVSEREAARRLLASVRSHPIRQDVATLPRVAGWRACWRARS